jgi:hypothetical protein
MKAEWSEAGADAGDCGCDEETLEEEDEEDDEEANGLSSSPNTS